MSWLRADDKSLWSTGSNPTMPGTQHNPIPGARKRPPGSSSYLPAEEPEIKLPTSAGSSEKQEFQKNIYFCIIDYAKAFDCVDHNKLWKILKEMGIPDHLPAS